MLYFLANGGQAISGKPTSIVGILPRNPLECHNPKPDLQVTGEKSVETSPFLAYWLRNKFCRSTVWGMTESKDWFLNQQSCVPNHLENIEGSLHSLQIPGGSVRLERPWVWVGWWSRVRPRVSGVRGGGEWSVGCYFLVQDKDLGGGFDSRQ